MAAPPSGYPYQAPPPMPHASTMAILSLISGIAAWLGLFGLGGLLAVIFGHIAKGEINKSNGWVTGGGMATIGLILGYANIVLSILGLCFFVLVFAGVFTAPFCMLPFMNGVSNNFLSVP